jgi:enterobacterial common antigen flippase
MSEKSSYAQILKASSIMSGAAGINLLLGMVRTKFAAVLIGTTGIGLLTSLAAIQGLIGIIAGLGIQSSAVREVAVAVGKNDDEAIGRAVLTLRRLSWFTGMIGMVAMMVLSPFLSQLTFASGEYTMDIAALGVIILLANISGGQMALIQGMRRIGDMARANIIGALLATVSAVSFYSWLGLRGIVPSLIVIAGMQLVISWYFARRVPVPSVELGWRETFTEASGMVRLGVVFMWTGLMSSIVGYITITLITQQVSLQAVGIYGAAFALSGMFVNFVLQAMGADYYPRLTSLAHDKIAMNRLVNEQTEIGLLLAVPGLLVTMVLAPWVIKLFYTSEFLPAVELMQWFILGAYGRVVSWPLGFVMLALGKSRWYFATETSAHVVHLFLITIGLTTIGLEGVAIAFPILYIGYTIIVYTVGRHLTGFSWSQETNKVVWPTLATLSITFIILLSFPLLIGTIIGAFITIISGILCLCSLVRRIGTEHRFVRAVCKIPGVKLICRI